MSINQHGKVLKSAGFESKKRHEKWLFAVIELSHDQIETRRKGFGYDPADSDECVDNEVDGRVVAPEPKLPF